MLKVSFIKPWQIEEKLLKFAVIAAKTDEKWIFCRHKARNTWEIPGGHREKGETIAETARRELREETGAVHADITPITVYGVNDGRTITYGMLFFAKVTDMESLEEYSEIGEVMLLDRLPENLTYPEIQPHLYRFAREWTETEGKI